MWIHLRGIAPVNGEHPNMPLSLALGWGKLLIRTSKLTRGLVPDKWACDPLALGSGNTLGGFWVHTCASSYNTLLLPEAPRTCLSSGSAHRPSALFSHIKGFLVPCFFCVFLEVLGVCFLVLVAL